MAAEFVDLLMKQAPLVIALCIGAYILWQRYDKFTTRTQSSLEESEVRFRKYMDEDRAQLIKIVFDNTNAMQNISKMCDRSNRVMECLIDEIKDFKKSEVYQSHKNRHH